MAELLVNFLLCLQVVVQWVCVVDIYGGCYWVCQRVECQLAIITAVCFTHMFVVDWSICIKFREGRNKRCMQLIVVVVVVIMAGSQIFWIWSPSLIHFSQLLLRHWDPLVSQLLTFFVSWDVGSPPSFKRSDRLPMYQSILEVVSHCATSASVNTGVFFLFAFTRWSLHF